MASSQKFVAFCICLLLVPSSLLVEAQGLMGGGKHGGKHGGDMGIETLLAAGIVAAILQGNGGGFGGARSASGRHATYEAPAHPPVPYAWRQPVHYVSEGSLPQPMYRMPPQGYGF